MEEIWKDIDGYDGIYKISNKGNVYSCISNKLMVGSITKSGYRQVILKGNGKIKAISIHRAVAQAFIENPNNLPQVNHKDENKLNNCVENLEWCSCKYNSNYGDAQIRRIEKWRKAKIKSHYTDDECNMIISGNYTYKELSVMLNRPIHLIRQKKYYLKKENKIIL